ncbi:hypothetical protein F5883DRAFT_717617 [Diaporthe sp. PMI_573]|nr:hypothetical protein F5883DRAFT_717617 [Diaporthaceae sp. PMI_573]
MPPPRKGNQKKRLCQGWIVLGGARLCDDHIHRLADICPNLEHLRIEVRRSRGDAAEVARYRSLGRLPRLQKLDLYLDVSPPGYVDDSTPTSHDTDIEPWFDKQDAVYLRGRLGPYRQGHMRDVFLNSAIDEALALSIFEVINGAKPKSPGRVSPLPLEHVYLRTSGGDAFPQGTYARSTLTPFLTALEHWWGIERDVREDAREVFHVNEDRWKWTKTSFQSAHSDPAKENQQWLGLWRRVWPVEKEGVL